MISIEKNLIKITGCCAPPRCCPEIEVYKEDNEVILRDDFGTTVHMSVDQFRILAEEFLQHV